MSFRRRVTVGNISHTFERSNRADGQVLVPDINFEEFFGSPNTKYAKNVVDHLKWLLQKDMLGQDVLLLGTPGPFRRRLLRYYCSLAGREVETVTVTGETSEADLKERREIRSGQVEHFPQPPLQAAVFGRMLILDGIHRAERNVLPALNNLLENREMNLSSGYRLVHPEAAKNFPESIRMKLPADFEKGENDMVLACHPDFRVAALASPVPIFPGYPIDPPFRSRFQCRVAEDLMDEERMALEFLQKNKKKSAEAAARIVELLHSVKNRDGIPQTLPLIIGSAGQKKQDSVQSAFPIPPPNCVLAMSAVAENATDEDLTRALRGSYPIDAIEGIPEASSARVESITEKFHKIAAGDNVAQRLAAALESGKHICVVGKRGSGKTHVIHDALEAHGKLHNVRLVHCYKDMSAAELLQRRIIDDSGNSSWQDSQLVRAAIAGDVVVIDGVNRCQFGILNVIASLLEDGEASLPSGGRLVSDAAYHRLAQRLVRSKSITEEEAAAELQARDIRKVHESFTVIGTGEPPHAIDSPWMTTEMLTTFTGGFVSQFGDGIDSICRRAVMKAYKLKGQDCTDDSAINALVEALHPFFEEVEQVKPGFSSRVITRITTQYVLRGKSAQLRAIIERNMLLPFLPPAHREQLDAILDRHFGTLEASDAPKPTLSITEQTINIGDVSLERGNPVHRELVPVVPSFYPMPSQMVVMQQIMFDLKYGEQHLLLIGNQGTGKNKITDRLLQMLNWEREYLQLNRDSTVQSLTITPSVSGGVMKWEPSPLLEAIKHGRIAVIDEADKAPLEVVCVLKSLFADGQLPLPDGRTVRRLPHGVTDPSELNSDDIFVHPNFKCIVLANRPGFPFLGNDFYRECGDVFSVHIVANPDESSELDLLRSLAPNITEAVLSKLCTAFANLRQLADNGSISYPFSTRELVNVARHLNAFPEGGAHSALRNVFDFDSFDHDLFGIVCNEMEKAGIVLERSSAVHLGFTGPLQAAPATAIEDIPEDDKLTQLVKKWQFSPKSTDAADQEKLLFEGEMASRDISYEVSSEFRVLKLNVIDATRSYIFSELIAEMAVEGFRTGSPSRLIHQLLSIDSLGVTLVLCHNPNSLLVLKRDAETGMLDESPLDVDITFCSGKIDKMILADEEGEPAVVLVSTETATVFHWKIGRSLVGNKAQSGVLRKFTIPADVLYEPTALLSHEKVAPYFKTLVNENKLMKLGARFVNAHEKISVGSSADGTVAMWNHATGLLAHIHPSTGRIQVFATPVMKPLGLGTSSTGSFCVGADGKASYVSTQKNFEFQVWGSDQVDVAEAAMMKSSSATTVAALRERARQAKTSPKPQAKKHAIPSVELTVDESALLAVDTASHRVGSAGKHGAAIWNAVQQEDIRPLLQEAGIIDAEGVHSGSQLRLRPMCVSNARDSMLFTLTTEQSEAVWLVHIDTTIGSRRILRFRLSSSDVGPSSAAYINGSSEALVGTVDGTFALYQLNAQKLEIAKNDWLAQGGDSDNDNAVSVVKGEDLAQNSTESDGGYDAEAVAEFDHDAELSENAENQEPASEQVDGDGDGNDDGEEGRGGGKGSGSGSGSGKGSGGSGAGGGGTTTGSAGAGSRGQGQESDGTGGYSFDAEGNALSRQRKARNLSGVTKQSSSGVFDYDTVLQRVQPFIKRIVDTLQAAEAAEKEREWRSFQVQGELDDKRLVESVIGDQNVFKRRHVPPKQLGVPQRLPKYIDFVIDVSASMARFNNWDGRLDRLVDCLVLMMESTRRFPQKFQMEIHGHSGSAVRLPLLTSSLSRDAIDSEDEDPANFAKRPLLGGVEKESSRRDAIDRAASHSKMCMSGDGTIEGLRLALENASRLEADEKFVILVSDANLGGYGVSVAEVKETLDRFMAPEPQQVKPFIIFLAEPKASEYFVKNLPQGVAFQCGDTEALPRIIRDILIKASD